MNSRYESIVIDLEFTGTPNDLGIPGFTDEVIDIGAVRVDCQGNILDSFHTFVKPEYAESVSKYVTRLTGISDRDLIGAPCFVEAMDLLTSWIGTIGSKRMVAWSKADKHQIDTESMVKGYALPMLLAHWIDLQAILPRVMHIGGRGKHMSLKRAAEWYGNEISLEESHHALYDAMQTADLLAQLLNGSLEEHIRVLDMVMPQRGRRAEEHAGMGPMAGLLSELFHQMGGNKSLVRHISA